jgi:ArsR family transcriptional regulator, arsenate/arsenite/antimonite-responsive transcriptional repressor
MTTLEAMADNTLNHMRDAATVYSGNNTDTAALAAMFKALSDPTRLRIFDLLMEGVQCNCEIAERLDLSLSLISHHLRILREVGLVNTERDANDARWIYYSVDREVLTTLVQQVAHFLDGERIQPRAPSCGPGYCSHDDDECDRAQRK